MHGLIVLLGMVTFVAVLVLLAIRREALDYNHGICPRCESQNEFVEMRKLKKFDEDSQGGRGYKCGLDKNGYGVLEELADVLITTYAVELSKLFTSKQIDMACDIKLNRAYDRLPDNLKMEEDRI